MATVAIPIETKVREFHGKLWLGLNLIQRGHSVILGPSDEIKSILYLSQPDIYITKDPSDNNINFLSELKDANCKICGLDTEGAVYPTLEKFGQNKTESLRYYDRYFLWGTAQAEFLRGRTDSPERLIPTGNPRFDLLSSSMRSMYSGESESLNSKYGDYILFNMNFSWANHYNPKNHIRQQKRLFGEYDTEKYGYVSILWNEFVAAIHYLQSKLNINIIVRPHPSEDHSTYEDIFRNYNNVYVEHSGDVRNWIAGATVTIHNSCTTGIEGALMEKPVVAYRPAQNQNYDIELPNLVSDEVYSRKNLYKQISHYLGHNNEYELSEEQSSELKRYFHNIDLLAAGLIADEIDSLEASSTTDYQHLKPELEEQAELYAKSSFFSDQIVYVYDSMHKWIGNSEQLERREYRAQKFPGLSLSEIGECVKVLDPHIDIDSITISKLSLTNNSFILNSSSENSVKLTMK